jgi:hypothetical protein
MRFAGSVALALALLGILVRPVTAQLRVTSADIERLQENIDEASRDIAQLRGREASLASQLQADLDAARDEAGYFRIKLRRNESIPRTEYVQVRDKDESIRSRARGDVSGGYTPPTSYPDSRTGSVATTGTVESSSSDDVPVGTEFDVRVQHSLSSKTAQVEDRFEATTIVDLKKDGRVVVPAGSVMRGMVSAVTKAGRIERKGSLTFVFDRITIDGRSYPIRATVTQAIESEGIKGEAEKIGAGAGVGAIIGGILGGVKGALAGILIGGGGTIAATEGKDVELPAGTLLRVRMDSGLSLR